MALTQARGAPILLLMAAAMAACTSTPQAASDPGTAGDDVVDAFFATATDESLTMHVIYEGSTSIELDDGSASDSFDITGEMDAVGEDFAGTITIDSNDQQLDAEVVRIGEDAYVRGAGGEWQAVDDEGGQPVNPFAKLESPADLEYVGETTWEGQSVHHLRTEKWLGDDPSTMVSESITDVAIEDHTFEIFVTGEGVPVGGELTAEMAGVVNGEAATVSNSYTYTFEDVGEPVTIEAPIPGG